MAELFSSGRAIDIILAVIVVEAGALALLQRRSRRGLRLVDVLGQLSAGIFLLLAVRSALTGAPWPVTALFLVASLPAHAIDLARRWRAASERSSKS